MHEFTEKSIGNQVYDGKAKRVFKIHGHDELVYLDFKDSLTAFNAQKKGAFANKGVLNRNMTSLIFRYLAKNHIQTHWQRDWGERGMIVLAAKIIPLEVVVRNVLAGSTAKKFGLAEGTPLGAPLTEFFLKNDELGDPFVSDEQALMLEAATLTELHWLKQEALKINDLLKIFFRAIGLKLIDFKIEFGRLPCGTIILADEITPDSCRLWDVKTNEKMDKDRFRRDLGNIEETYTIVWQKMVNYWEKEL